MVKVEVVGRKKRLSLLNKILIILTLPLLIILFILFGAVILAIVLLFMILVFLFIILGKGKFYYRKLK